MVSAFMRPSGRRWGVAEVSFAIGLVVVGMLVSIVVNQFGLQKCDRRQIRLSKND